MANRSRTCLRRRGEGGGGLAPLSIYLQLPPVRYVRFQADNKFLI